MITAPGLATESVPAERRGMVIGFLTSTTGLGTSVLAIGTRTARNAAGDDELWRPVYAVEALVACLILLAVVVLVRAGSTVAIGKGITLDSLRRLDHWKRITVAYVLFGAIAAGYSSFLAETMEADTGLSRSSVASVYTGMGIVSIVAAPMTGMLSDRIGRRAAMLGVLFALAVGSTAVALGGPALVVVSVLVLGGMWSSYPALTATYVRDHLDARAFGSAYGTMTIFYGFTAILTPVSVGVLADRLGSFTVPYLAIAALAAVAAAVLFSIRPGQRSDVS